MKIQVEEKFSDFYKKWMSQLEDYLQLVQMVSNDHSQNKEHEAMIINKLTVHHKDYYAFKWALAHEDVLAFFAPVWLSPLENVHLWITGWKPSIAFRLIEPLLRVAQPEQVKKIEGLRVKVKMEEEKVEREMERQQVAMADRKMVELAMMERRAKKNGGTSDVAQVSGLVEVALQGWLGGLEKVMKMADCVRLRTMKGVLDVLSPGQGVDFLVFLSAVQIQIRKWGEKERRKL